MLNIDIVPCLQDNYSFIVHDTNTNTVAVVDPSEFKPINNFIEKKFKKIDYILNTHYLIPGHTSGHICFYAKNEKIIFTGDTLFSLGCGRVFEGTHLEMFESLKLIKKLPIDTQIYCGHEYTQKNLEFCIKYEINNDKLAEKKKWIISRLSQKQPTIPVTVKEELNTNIFLRCDNSEVKKSLDMQDSTELEVFRKLRDLKDDF